MTMAPAVSEVTVLLRTHLRDQLSELPERRTLTRAQVDAVAPTAPPGGEDRVSALVAGRLVAARELVAAALGCAPADVALGQAARALTDLGFIVTGHTATPSGRIGRASQPGDETITEPPARRPEHDTGLPSGVLSSAVARRLRRHVGRWVAIRDNDVVAVGDSLRDVVSSSAPSDTNPVMVLFVAPPGADGPE